MRKLNKILIIFYVFTFIVVSLGISLLPLAKDKNYYLEQYKINNVIEDLQTESYIEVSEQELEGITDKMISYLFGEEERMQYILEDGTEFFSSQAIEHMRDVRTLFVNGVIVFYVFLFIFLILTIYLILNFKKIKVNYSKIYTIVSLFFISIILIVLVYALIDFDGAFTLFHKIMFPNEEKFENAFFPSGDTLTTILPINFFGKTAFIIASTFSLFLVFGYCLTHILNLMNKHCLKSEENLGTKS